jgi:tetratricopeptide (TPR) repeat protein
MLINEYMKQYSVKIKSSFGKEGSGTIIKVDDEQYYLATALHNFTDSERDESWRRVFVPDLKEKFNDIKIIKNDKIVCSIIGVKDYHHDLIIFEVSSSEDFLNLAPTSISNDKFSMETHYTFHGYSAKDGGGVVPNLHTRDIVEERGNDYIFTLQSDQPKRITHLKGYSGSGVFTQYGVKFYLVGIVLERNDDSSSFYIFDLAKQLNEWTRKKNSIPLVQDVFDGENSPIMYTTMIRRNKNTFLSKKARRLFGSNHKYRDLLEDTVKLEKLSNYLENRNDLLELEEKYFKELADLYLLKTFIFNKQGKGKEAEKYFEKAKFYRPDYIRYTNEVKEVDSKKDLLDKGKLAYINRDYEEAKDNFIKSLHLDNIEIAEKILVYEKLLEISKFEKNDNELIKIYKILLTLYDDSNKLEKANIHYELSLLFEEDYNKWDELKKGLTLINYENSDEFIEIKYKILKYKNKIAEEGDISDKLRELLEKLAQTNPIYQDELSKVNQIEMDKILFEEEKLLFKKEIEEEKIICIQEKEEVGRKIEAGNIIAIIVIIILLVIVATLSKVNTFIIMIMTLGLLSVLFYWVRTFQMNK